MRNCSKKWVWVKIAVSQLGGSARVEWVWVKIAVSQGVSESWILGL
jgi:hypothetical protein